MGVYSIKPLFQSLLNPVKNLLIKLKVHPTTINILAVIISLTGAFAIFYTQYYAILWLYVPLMAFVRTALNALDGLVARELKVKNGRWGEVLNEFTDRFSDAVIFGSFLFLPYINTKLAAIAIILILLSSYLAIVSKAAGGKRQYIGLMGKADRMIYLSIASVLIFLTKREEIAIYLIIFIALAMLITIFQRFMAIKKELKK